MKKFWEWMRTKYDIYEQEYRVSKPGLVGYKIEYLKGAWYRPLEVEKRITMNRLRNRFLCCLSADNTDAELDAIINGIEALGKEG